MVYMIDKKREYDEKSDWLNIMGLFDHYHIETRYDPDSFNSFASFIDQWYENQK